MDHGPPIRDLLPLVPFERVLGDAAFLLMIKFNTELIVALGLAGSSFYRKFCCRFSKLVEGGRNEI